MPIVKTGSTDEQLLAGLARNDKNATETLYREYFGMIQAFILNNNGSSEDARDIFQEAMIVLYEKATSGRFELTAQVKTYLYSVCRRLWLKRLQQVQRFGTPVESMPELVQVEEDLEAHERRNEAFMMMEKALGHLGEPCRSLLEAYYLQKKNMQEISEHFGYTNAENAKNQKYKCLTRLKKMFFTQFKSGN
ncbi:RNA polymerase sigma factor (sigma-70 family) [Dinghuibacter silviterrae]|uniref:RNA polymerase sigma factor (Sigma-70 family) n=1 Tax=Dinghuibacter silviterrae TaxID=1539049 RepID=A0A4R8DHC8_9BACT|nr:RNA polymerase sigma factor (sigma-70 family) [Dinghuibacter silviterrae]